MLLIIQNYKRCLLLKGPKYIAAQPFTFQISKLWILLKRYARRCAKLENVELETLSDWIKEVKPFTKTIIAKHKVFKSTKPSAVFGDSMV